MILSTDLSAVTLNYSGVLTSPYQFYLLIQGKEPNRQISKLFQEVLTSFIQKEKIQNFAWNMGTIDTIWKNMRESPVNIVDAGIRRSNQQYILLSQQEFLKAWDDKLKNAKKYQKDLINYMERNDHKIDIKVQLQMCKIFDLCCHKTLVRYYCDKNLEKIQDFREEGKKYYQKRQEYFKKPYLNQKLKSEKTLKWIENTLYDIYFIQQANETLIGRLTEKVTKINQGNLQIYSIINDQYYLILNPGSRSIICVKKLLMSVNLNKNFNFYQSRNQFLISYLGCFGMGNKKLEDLINQLNFNNDSIFVVYGGYILLNVHLSSKEDKNKVQIAKLFYHYQNLRNFNKNNFTFVLGGDLNKELNKQELQSYNIHNNKLYLNMKATVMKMRSLIQPQKSKANRLDKSIKDYIFIQAITQNVKTVMLNQQSKQQQVKDECKQLLPCSGHPYDHLIVKVTIKKGIHVYKL